MRKIFRETIRSIIGERVAGVRVIPMGSKVMTLFVVILLLSNFFSNYIGLTMNRGEQLRLLQLILVRDLESLLEFSNDQYEIAQYSLDRGASLQYIAERAKIDFLGEQSVSLGVFPDGRLLFVSGEGSPYRRVDSQMIEDLSQKGINSEGILYFDYDDVNYIGVYKYNQAWEAYFIRAEELNEFHQISRNIFQQISYMILIVTLFCTLLGIILFRHSFRFVGVITKSIMDMQARNQPGIIDFSGAPNDDITYLGIAFNALSASVQKLINVFQKFASKETVQQIYQEQEVRLEGKKRLLAILFTDIRRFTMITETLGADIIRLLNLHYESIISVIHKQSGDVGSIIGDALLALFGVSKETDAVACLSAIKTAYMIQEATADLRKNMTEKKEEIVVQRGGMTTAEQDIYSAVMLEVGVGVDYGEVFYGNIGSDERMVNTAIGDNVNFASRLEGVTKLYMVPVLCSERVVQLVQQISDRYYFLEVDRVRVKGKTVAMRIFWPIREEIISEEMRSMIDNFSEALQYYYKGDWEIALGRFQKVALPVSEVFQLRIRERKVPSSDWSGVWQIEIK